MEIQSITLNTIREMQEILSESAGYAISIEDEIEYFNPEAAKSWYLVRGPDGQVLAFIRDCKQSSEWSCAEFFVKSGVLNRRDIALTLLSKFKSTISFPAGHRLRIDLSSLDVELNEIVHSEDFSEKCQTFFHFERNSHESERLSGLEVISNADAKGVAEALCNLHPVSEDEANKWIDSKTIRGIKSEGTVVAAAQIYESGDAFEVNRFATHEKFLRQGFAKKLMEQVFAEAANLGKHKVYLKVEDVRLPAISFYKSLGFVEIKDKHQNWHSRWF